MVEGIIRLQGRRMKEGWGVLQINVKGEISKEGRGRGV